MRKHARQILGYALLVAGIAGVMLPVVPGTPFILAAVAIPGADHRLIRSWKDRIERWKNMAGKPGKQL